MGHTSIKHPTAGECEDLKRSLMGHKSVNIFEEVPWKNEKQTREKEKNQLLTKWQIFCENTFTQSGDTGVNIDDGYSLLRH